MVPARQAKKIKIESHIIELAPPAPPYQIALTIIRHLSEVSM